MTDDYIADRIREELPVIDMTNKEDTYEHISFCGYCGKALRVIVPRGASYSLFCSRECEIHWSLLTEYQKFGDNGRYDKSRRAYLDFMKRRAEEIKRETFWSDIQEQIADIIEENFFDDEKGTFFISHSMEDIVEKVIKPNFKKR